MAEPTTDHEHGTAWGFNQHVKYDTEPCDPCRVAMNQYQNASKIRRGVIGSVRISLPALKEFLDGADVAEVLTRECGADVVAAIRESGGAS